MKTLILLAMLVPHLCFAEKKLIEYGWDAPSPAWVKPRIATMEQMPFDGLVMSVRWNDAGTVRLFANYIMGNESIQWSEVEESANALRDTSFAKFTDNFILATLMPGDIDWFDDFTHVLHNMGIAGRIVRHSGVKGVMWDIETYGADVFDFATQKYSAKSFAEYQVQVKVRGQQMLEAMQAEAPGLVVFLPFGYNQADPDRGELQTLKYGLLPAFLDGVFLGAKGSTIIVDGFEDAYGYKNEADFNWAYERMTVDALTQTTEAGAYQTRLSASYGIWLDKGSNDNGWDESAPYANHFSPQELKVSLTTALRKADHYVWLYNELPDWWAGAGTNVPADYKQAILDAKNSARQGYGTTGNFINGVIRGQR